MTPVPAARSRTLRAAIGILLAAVLGGTVAPTPALAEEAAILGAGAPNAVPGSYLVVLKDSAVTGSHPRARATELTGRFGGRIGHIYDAALNGYSVAMSEKAARRLAAHPAVAYVEQDVMFRLDATQPNPPSWGLDRIDQRARALDNSYTYPNTASNVNIYILDTGIRFTHNQFGGRAVTGFDAITSGGNAADCHGHGTHVAGTAAGSSYGVAKGARLYAVRVLDCSGSGTAAQLVAGINWVTNNAVKPAVANMSLGFTGINTAVDSAVTNSIASGVTYTIAAGNSNTNACNVTPARVSTAITVGATTIHDARASYSNHGNCVHIFAPGSGITSAWHTSNTATNTLDGTSMAAPHAAGAAAMVLSANPTWTPVQVKGRLLVDGTQGALNSIGASGTPNRLLHIGSSPDVQAAVAAPDGTPLARMYGTVQFNSSNRFRYNINLCRLSSYVAPDVQVQINGQLHTTHYHGGGGYNCDNYHPAEITYSGTVQTVTFVLRGSHFNMFNEFSYYTRSVSRSNPLT